MTSTCAYIYTYLYHSINKLEFCILKSSILGSTKQTICVIAVAQKKKKKVNFFYVYPVHKNIYLNIYMATA